MCCDFKSLGSEHFDPTACVRRAFRIHKQSPVNPHAKTTPTNTMGRTATRPTDMDRIDVIFPPSPKRFDTCIAKAAEKTGRAAARKDAKNLPMTLGMLQV